MPRLGKLQTVDVSIKNISGSNLNAFIFHLVIVKLIAEVLILKLRSYYHNLRSFVKFFVFKDLILRSIDEIIKFLLDKFNLRTESELAKLLGVEANTLSGWKKREKIPFENLLKLSNEKKISFDEILGNNCNIFDINATEAELLENIRKLPKEKQEVYILRIKADAIELGLV